MNNDQASSNSFFNVSELSAAWERYRKIDLLEKFKSWGMNQNPEHVMDVSSYIYGKGPMAAMLQKQQIINQIISESAFDQESMKREQKYKKFFLDYYEALNMRARDYWKDAKKMFIDPCLSLMATVIEKNDFLELNSFIVPDASPPALFTRFQEDQEGPIPFKKYHGIFERTRSVLFSDKEMLEDYERNTKMVRECCIAYYSNAYTEWDEHFEKSIQSILKGNYKVEK